MLNFIFFSNESHRHNINGDIFAVYYRKAWTGMDRRLNRLVGVITLSILFRRMPYVSKSIKKFLKSIVVHFYKLYKQIYSFLLVSSISSLPFQF